MFYFYLQGIRQFTHNTLTCLLGMYAFLFFFSRKHIFVVLLKEFERLMMEMDLVAWLAVKTIL